VVWYRCGRQTFTTSRTTDRTTAAPPLRLPQTPAGITTLPQHLHALGIQAAATLIVLEATGSYWIGLAVALHSAGYVVNVVNPKPVHHCAQSLPCRGKTDALDAHMLTHSAWERQPRSECPPPEVDHQLRQRLTAFRSEAQYIINLDRLYSWG
jgi:transposase